MRTKLKLASLLSPVFHGRLALLFALLVFKVSLDWGATFPHDMLLQETATQILFSTNLSQDIQMLESLGSLPIEQEDEIIRRLHGEEWWYPLTCPTNSYTHRNYSVVVGYHIGILGPTESYSADPPVAFPNVSVRFVTVSVFIRLQ